MSAECPSCLPLDCSGFADIDLYSLEADIFGFVPICPKGYNCNIDEIHMVCCGQDLFVVFPPGTTPEQRQEIIVSLTAECVRRRQFCGEFNPPPPCGEAKCLIPPPPFLYYSEPAFCDVKCPDGNNFHYIVRAGMFLMPTQEQANYVAAQYACKQAKDHQICLGDLPTDPVCADGAYSQTIKATGNYLAVFPESDFWEISEGTLPPGLTFHGGFLTPHQVLIDGTPTTAGVYTFTVRVTEQTIGPAWGDYTEKEYTITAVAISPSSLPDGTIGTAYSQQFTVDPDHDVETEVWSLSSGTLPAGLELSEDGLLSGTPTGLGASYNLTFQVKFEDTASGKTVTCTKALTLKVNGVVSLIAYWNFESKGPAPFYKFTDDTGNGNDLNSSHLAATPAGKIGNCVQPNNRELSTSGNIPLDSTKGFTICGWMKADPGDIFAGLTLAFNITNQFELFLDYDPDPVIKVLHSNHSANIAELDYPIDFDWHFFRGWFDPADNKLRIQLDNGIIAITPLGFSFGDIVVTFPTFNSDSNFFDEVGIWNKVLSDADADALWNSGNGQTYPNVPP